MDEGKDRDRILKIVGGLMYAQRQVCRGNNEQSFDSIERAKRDLEAMVGCRLSCGNYHDSCQQIKAEQATVPCKIIPFPGGHRQKKG